MTKYPICEALLKSGERCRSVVVSLDGDELSRRFCSFHARQAAETAAEQPDGEEEGTGDAPSVDDLLPAAEDAVVDVAVDAPAEVVTEDVVTTTTRGPRESIREFALRNPHLVDEFLKGVLAAEQETYVTCQHCRKRTAALVPSWHARTKAVELLLEQGFGKPEAAPLDEDEQLWAVAMAAVKSLSEETLLEVAGLQDFQRKLLALPLDVQMGLSEADEDELVAVAQRRGYLLGSAAS